MLVFSKSEGPLGGERSQKHFPLHFLQTESATWRQEREKKWILCRWHGPFVPVDFGFVSFVPFVLFFGTSDVCHVCRFCRHMLDLYCLCTVCAVCAVCTFLVVCIFCAVRVICAGTF